MVKKKMFKFFKKNKKIKKIKIVLSSLMAKVPTRSHKFDAGLDLYASENKRIEPHSTALIKTGVRIQIPSDCWGAVCSRSGLALKESVFVLNAPGVVDSTYRKEIGVILRNESDKPFIVDIGDRVGQIVIMKYENVELVKAKALDNSERGNNGFGSTGR